MSESPPRACPRCAGRLRSGKYADVPLEMCADCHGVLIGQKSLHPLLRAMTVELVKSIDLDQEI
ncbi:MAG: zf-TFIIB domain-containing protein, partial [Planctomycetes bacterium]|nr:zf-TFIIB domain-containing protein [Planctomycetota bacterium]